MKKSKILYMFISLFLIIWMYYLYWDKLLDNSIHIPKEPIENIDASFLNNQVKEDIINNSKKFIWVDESISFVQITTNSIRYYDFNHNILIKNEKALFEINNIFKKYNITFLEIYIDKNYIKKIKFSINDDYNYLYVYESDKHKYRLWYTFPNFIWRVEKVIDENWYILRKCENRNMCQESQG